MRKLLIVLLACLAPYCTQAQTTQPKSPKLPVNANDPADVWMVVYKVDATGFPSGAFSMDNADFFMNAAGNWITANQTVYRQLLSKDSGADVLVLKRSDYGNVDESKKPEFKRWMNEMSGYFKSQDPYQVDQKRRYLLSAEDFNKLQDFLKK